MNAHMSEPFVIINIADKRPVFVYELCGEIIKVVREITAGFETYVGSN